MSKILILGAGFVAGPLVDYLAKRQDNELTIASPIEADNQRLINGYNNIKTYLLDVSDESTLSDLIAGHDIVVSLIPYQFHPIVASHCVKHSKHLVTASYETEQLRAFDAEAQSKGITIINEIGLDPGIDHLSAMHTIDLMKANQETITGFISWCGGIPAPAANNNPLGYKFAWSPRAVLQAVLNDAVFMHRSQTLTIDSEHLLGHAKPCALHPDWADLEGYPNRDAITYRAVYRLKFLTTLFRGTLRYKGFSAIIQATRNLGLLCDKVDETLQNQGDTLSWRALLAHQLSCSEAHVEHALKSRDFSDEVVDALIWLGLNVEQPIGRHNTRLDAFCALLLSKMRYQDDEADRVLLQHKFVSRHPDGRTLHRTASLEVLGDIGGHSAMAKTVGIPVGIVTQSIVDGIITRRGTVLPVRSDIYQPILEQLSEQGIIVEEQQVETDVNFLKEIDDIADYTW